MLPLWMVLTVKDIINSRALNRNLHVSTDAFYKVATKYPHAGQPLTLGDSLPLLGWR